MNNKEKDIYEILKKLNISYKIYEHEAIHTIEEANQKGVHFEGLNLKNLLLKDKKTNHFYLVILEDNQKINRKELKQEYQLKEITFATEEELYSLMKLVPGEVGPFGLIYDQENKITVILSKSIKESQETTLINFHPNRNTATIAITKKDFLKYLNYLKKEILQ